MNPLIDEKQRQQATDPTQSFIVQAPAGSGKTELLTQRYLRLLAHVEKPEHIVAITFTKKAAAEMKARILGALSRATNNTPIQSAHHQQTNTYAQAVLKRNVSLDWELLEQPHRLRIMTIDSFCHMLSHAMPVLDKELPFAEITDKPEHYYFQAARNTLKDALNDDGCTSAMQTLLTHLDNRQDLLFSLFVALLACRDQWLDVVLSARTLSRDECEATLERIELHTLQRLLQATPFAIREELRTLSQQVSHIDNNPESPRYALQAWERFEALSREQAQGLSALWLTQENQLRKGFDHHVGFRKNQCSPQTYTDLKSRSQALCEVLCNHPDWISLLANIRNLPNPHYDSAQWTVLQALFTLLPYLAAQLHLVFQDNNALDFTAVAQQAIHALGDEDNPSDLTLHLDYSIYHLLIDEFQDTSLQQMRLLERLTQGWQPFDGRTLFIVGDPMQSIYRFRQAEVGLFLKARAQGIGSMILTPLHLSANFRSQGNIIRWINQQFQTIFPLQEDIQSGAIAFHPATAIHPDSTDSHVKAHALENKTQEAAYIVACIQKLQQQYPDDDIALLVRSRGQLSEMIPLLRKQQIPFQGVDIEKLSSLAHIRDIWILTQALLYPGNRLVGLAFLRSPWCGLQLADLLTVAEAAPEQSIFEILAHIDTLTTLNPDAITRLQYVYSVMANAVTQRHQRCLTETVIHVANQLHAKLLFSPEERDDFEQFFQLIDRHEQYGLIPDLPAFQKDFDSLYSKRAKAAKLHIMTIHKSKGLEFDTVILPGLGTKPKLQDNPLFRWLKIPTDDQTQCLLISPIHPYRQNPDKLYNYLGDIEKEKAHYETQRLLYVAATRAKKRLYLTDYQDRNTKGSLRYLLKDVSFEKNNITISQGDAAPPQHDNPFLTTTRLPEKFYYHVPVALSVANNLLQLPEQRSLARIQGIIAHEMLQWICTHHPDPIEFPRTLFNLRCRQAGFTASNTDSFYRSLMQQITTMQRDPIGQWICQVHHDEKNEFELLTYEKGRASTYIIDRTFEDNGLRWIIDFKTTHSLEKNQAYYAEQLNRYVSLMSALTTLPIHCGIYYLTMNAWNSWPAIIQAENSN